MRPLVVYALMIAGYALAFPVLVWASISLGLYWMMEDMRRD